MITKLKKGFMACAFILLFLFFLQAFVGVGSLEGEADNQSIKVAEESIKKMAVQCYALEGSYPPNIDYLVSNYGLIVNDKEYFYFYEVIASNIMPNITVIRR